MNWTDWVIGIAAGLGLAFSLLTLYLSHLRSATLRLFVGPTFVLGIHPTYQHFTVPISFTNSGAKVGVVRRCALILSRRDNPQENYYMAWNAFYEIADHSGGSRTWVHKDTAHAVPVLSRSTESRSVEFKWRSDSPPLELTQGLYDVRVDIWGSGSKPSRSVLHELHLSAWHEKQIRAMKTGVKQSDVNKVLYLTLDNQLDSNRVFTRHELAQLLG